MFRRIRYRKCLVAGLGVAALVAPASAVAGNHNMSDQASRALVAKGQAMNRRYAGVAQGAALNTRYQTAQTLSSQAASALLAKSEAMNQRYATYAQGQALDTRYESITAGPVVSDGRSPDTVDFAAQAHSPVVTVQRDPGFQWGDFGIGLASAMFVIALLGITRLFSGRGQRPVATS